jgi:hypothetical protein
VTDVPSFEKYVASLSPFVPRGLGVDAGALELCQRATATIGGIKPLDRAKLAEALSSDPDVAPVLAAVVGLSQERFKTWLQGHFGTAGWITLSRTRAADLIAQLDEDFALVDALEAEAATEWTWADVLARVMSPRQRAGGWVQQGRDLEDAVEATIKALGLPYVARTRFQGRADLTAPADFAIPNGAEALIAVAVKGFDSTGSKLSDATREIEQMVEAKTPRQYIFAVVDGQGWVRRQGDLRRIHDLWQKQHVDGVYPRGELDAFAAAVENASKRLGLL